MRAFPLMLTSALALTAGAATAQQSFNRIASFATPTNMAAGEDTKRVTSAEIISVSEDGMTLIYTDSPLGVVGLIDITDPAKPLPKGNIDVDGEPTTAVILGQTAFVAVNTSESYTAPSGALRSIDLATAKITESCDLGGQPDSVAKAPDGSFLAIAIENERDEDAGDGRVPQMPAGFVVTLPLVNGAVDCAGKKQIDLTGIAAIAGDDPEPEFVDINAAGEIAVTLQENNHIVVLSKDGAVLSQFSAGAVDLTGIDTKDERGAIRFTDSQPGRLREPDAVQWIDNDHFAVANEGDMDGGARGFTIFAKDGTVVFESGNSLELAIAKIGHYPDKRSDAKGVEPEGLEFATINGTPMLFVLTERASIAAVYDITDPKAPVLKQLLPSGVSPEGAVAIPARGLLATANEVDFVEDGGARSHVMIYALQDGAPAYPMIEATGDVAAFGALSGMVAGEGKTLYAVNDSFFGFQPTIFTIDASQKPAKVTSALAITRAGMPAQKLDIEGIALDGKGGFWIASEGYSERLVPHAIYNVNAKGEIKQEIALPAALLAGEKRFGFEGITQVGNRLWMAVQREWGDDPKGMVKLMAYDLEAKEWGAVHYPLNPVAGGWIGLSEITAHGDYVYIVERDNQIGAAAVEKKLYRVPVAQLVPAKPGEALPVVTKELVRDLLPDLGVLNGYAMDKIEGFAITADGEGFVVTDNDGVDDASGETLFWSIGKM